MHARERVEGRSEGIQESSAQARNLPERVLTNVGLAGMVYRTDEAIRNRTGSEWQHRVTCRRPPCTTSSRPRSRHNSSIAVIVACANCSSRWQLILAQTG